jgi:hypothetical protein
MVGELGAVKGEVETAVALSAAEMMLRVSTG